jgi:putative GTP pyrophosphokinase
LEAKDWEKFFIPYEQAVDELVIKFEILKKQHITLGEYSPIELVLGRVKKLSSILEKARKNNFSLDIVEKKIDDIAGIRIICQFVDDIDKVVELIRNRDGKDLNIICEKDYINNKKESGYRSYHIIIKYPVQYALGHKDLLAEIQIRTMAMNFWATIEHSLNYKYKENIPENVRKRLKNAAEAAFLLDQEMFEIRKEIRDAQKLFNIRSSTISQILHHIKILYQDGKLDLAEKYQNVFAELWEKGDLTMLMSLEVELENLVED